MITETWKPVVGYESHYFVSDQGRVRNKGGRILALRLRRDGYPHVALCDSNRPCQRATHRLVAEAFLGPCAPGYEVNHKNGVRSDPRLDNLEYVTRSENNIHAYRVLGRRSALRKLTAGQVNQMRSMHASGTPQKQLACVFSTGRANVSRIVNQKRWVVV